MTKQRMTVKEFFTTMKKWDFFTIQNVNFPFLKRFFNKIWSFCSRKRFFIALASVYILCVIYGFARNFFYYMENDDVLIPDASEEEQLNNKQIYIHRDFILDLYSYKERFEKDLEKEEEVKIIPAIFNKQYLENWNYLPKKKLILKTKNHSFLWIFDLQYITNTLFQKKFITYSSNIQIFRRKDKNGNLKTTRKHTEPYWIETLKRYPYSDCDDGICTLTNKDWSQYTIEISKYEIPYTGYTMSWDIFTLDIPRTKFIETDDIDYCESFVRPDCSIFKSFIQKPRSFYYDIWIDWKNIQPWDTLSIISVE